MIFPFWSVCIARHLYFVTPLSMINWSGIQASVCIRISTSHNRNYWEFDSRPRSRPLFGISGLGYREKPVLDSSFGRNPLRTAAANGKRIHPSIGLSGAHLKPASWPVQWNPAATRIISVTVGNIKLEVTLLIELDWINYEHSFVLLSLKFIPGKIID